MELWSLMENDSASIPEQEWGSDLFSDPSVAFTAEGLHPWGPNLLCMSPWETLEQSGSLECRWPLLCWEVGSGALQLCDSCRNVLLSISLLMSSGPCVYIHVVQRRWFCLIGQVWVDFEGQAFCSGWSAVGVAVWLRGNSCLPTVLWLLLLSFLVWRQKQQWNKRNRKLQSFWETGYKSLRAERKNTVEKKQVQASCVIFLALKGLVVLSGIAVNIGHFPRNVTFSFFPISMEMKGLKPWQLLWQS